MGFELVCALTKCIFCLNPSEMATWPLVHTMVLPREVHCGSVLLH